MPDRTLAPRRRLAALPALLVAALLATALVAAPAAAGTGSQLFVRGDANSDGAVDIGDAIFILSFLFTQGTSPGCPDAADANDDGSVDIGDAISILGYLFSGAGTLPPPFPAPGVDPTPADRLICGDPCLPEELCNGLDDDCDGSVDEDAVDAIAYYPDLDLDGYGRAGVPPLLSCEVPPGMVANAEDCDDDDGGVFPGAAEFCNGEDDDCDGTPDEDAADALPFWPDGDADGFGSDASPPVLACTAPAGHVGIPGDCDDDDGGIFPGGTEFCDGEDDDCDGTPDDDAIDALAFWPDADGDGFGDATALPLFACTAPPAHVPTDHDCDDADLETYPGAPEKCGDGIDQDCDGFADEVTLDDLLEPARPPAAMPGRCAPALLHPSLAIDARDPAKSSTNLHGIVHNAARAEVVLDEIDLVLPGVGTDLVFQRRYRSRRLGASGAMGNQWEHSYEIRAFLAPDGLHLFDGDHREDVLVLQPDGMTWSRPGLPITAYSSGVDIYVEFGNGGVWRLEPRGGGGGGGGGGWRLAEIADAHANQILCAYDTSGRLSTITDTVGRIVTLTYGPSGRISALSDGTGRTWVYAYYAPGEPGGSEGDLKSVTTPAIVGTPTGNDFPLGRTTTYTYSSGHADDRLNHNLLTISDPRGNLRVTVEYDLDPASPTADAALAQQIGGHRWSASLHCADPATDHGAVLRVIGNDDRGAVTEVFLDPLHRTVMRRDFTGFAPDPLAPTTPTDNRPGPPLRPSDPPYFETLYEWNSDHRLTRVVHPDGNEVQLVYEVDLDPTTVPLYRTNLRQVVRTPGSHPGGGTFPALVDSYELQNGFGGFAGHEFRVLHTNPRVVAIGTVRDETGRALHIERPLPGASEDFEWDTRGRLTAHVRMNHDALALPTGRRRDEFTYHASGPGIGLLASRLIDAAAPLLVSTFDYDARGNLVHVVHPSGNDETIEVNALGEPVRTFSRAIDSTGTRYETRYSYDANGNRVRVDVQNRDADGAVVAANPFLTRIVEYDAQDCVSRLLEEEGIWFVLPGQLDGAGLPASEFVTTGFVHDVAGRLLREESGVATNGSQPGAVIEHEYDERGFLFRSTRAPNTAEASTAQWAYGKNGAPNVFDRFGFGAGPRQTTSTYDGFDRLVSETDPMGNVRSFEYDENGNVTRLILHGELDDQPGGSSNIRLAETEWTYDLLDRRTGELAHRFDPATQTANGGENRNWDFTGGGHLLSRTDDSGDTTTWEYDSVERLALTTDAMGNQIELGYDLHSNVISELHRDLSGMTPGAITLREWTHAYDGLDRRTSSSGPIGETRTWAHAWHGVGRMVDERGNVVRLIADSLGRVTRTEADLTVSGTGGTPVVGTAVHQHVFDDNGRRVLHIDPNGHSTSYEYDLHDRLTRVVRADGTDEVAAYDAHGDRLSEVDANGTLRTYLHDLLSRRIAASILAAPGVDGSATFASFTYDSEGRVRAALNDDALVVRGYDSLGNPGPETVNGLTASLVTDDEGHPTLLTYPSGRQIAYDHDPLGRVHQVSEGPALLATCQYVGPGCLEWLSTGNGVTTQFSYDLSRRLVLVSGTNGVGSSVVASSYGWDPARNLVTRADGTGSQITKVHQYDSLDRLVATQSSSPGLPPSFVNYQLDTAGNRLFVGGLSFSGPYSMDPTLPEPADAQMHQYTQTPADQRQYTAAGDLSVVTSLSPAIPETSYHYDGLGQLRSRQAAGLPPTEYDYDALGRVVRIHAGGDTSNLVYCFGGAELAVHDAGGAEVESSVYGHGTGGGMRIGMRRVGLSGAQEDLYFHTDSAGSVVRLTDSGGAVVESYEYGDHGQLTVLDPLDDPIPASQVGNVHLFHGHRLDASGRLYMIGGADFFEPETGRMLSSLDNDTGAIDFVRWGAVDVPSGDLLSNPASVTSHVEGDFDRDGYTDLVVVGDSVRINDTDPSPSLFTEGEETSRWDIERWQLSGWWGHCNGWAGAALSMNSLDPDDDCDGIDTLIEGEDFLARGIGPIPRSGTLVVVIEGDARAGLRTAGGGGGGGGGCGASGVYPRDSGPIIRGSALGGSRFRDDPYAEDAAHSRGGFATTSPGHKYIDTLTLRAGTGSVGKPVRNWIQTAAKGKNIRKDISVTLVKSDKSHGRAGKQYIYIDCFPTRWSAQSLLSATGTGSTMEEVTVKPIRLELK